MRGLWGALKGRVTNGLGSLSPRMRTGEEREPSQALPEGTGRRCLSDRRWGLAVSVGGTVDAFSVDPGGWAQSQRREELTAGLPPLARARRLLVQDRREGGVPVPRSRGERESSQARAARREGGPWCWTLSRVSQGILSPWGPQGLCRRHLKAWPCLVGSHLGPQTATPSSAPCGARSSPSCLVAVGECRLQVISSHGACVRMSHDLGPASVLTPLLPSEPSPAVIPAPGLLPATPPFLVLDPSCLPSLLSHRLPGLTPIPDSACDPKHSLVPSSALPVSSGSRQPAWPEKTPSPRLVSLD